MKRILSLLIAAIMLLCAGCSAISGIVGNEDNGLSGDIGKAFASLTPLPETASTPEAAGTDPIQSAAPAQTQKQPQETPLPSEIVELDLFLEGWWVCVNPNNLIAAPDIYYFDGGGRVFTDPIYYYNEQNGQETMYSRYERRGDKLIFTEADYTGENPDIEYEFEIVDEDTLRFCWPDDEEQGNSLFMRNTSYEGTRRLRLSDNYKYLAEGPMLAYVSPHWSETAPDSGRGVQLLVDDVICLSADEDALDVALMVELGYANAVPDPNGPGYIAELCDPELFKDGYVIYNAEEVCEEYYASDLRTRAYVREWDETAGEFIDALVSAEELARRIEESGEPMLCMVTAYRDEETENNYIIEIREVRLDESAADAAAGTIDAAAPVKMEVKDMQVTFDRLPNDYNEFAALATDLTRPENTCALFMLALDLYTRDKDAGKFMVTSARNLIEANPDVLDFSQVTGCRVDVDESRSELKRKDSEGNEVSYNPPRYEYSYDFFIIISVNHPYFDEMRFKLNSSSVEINNVAGGPFAKPVDPRKSIDYLEYEKLGKEISDALTKIRSTVRENIAAANAPRASVKCPYCGAVVVPDSTGKCEFCGSVIAI